MSSRKWIVLTREPLAGRGRPHAWTECAVRDTLTAAMATVDAGTKGMDYAIKNPTTGKIEQYYQD
jgi:hypothetical protein